MVTFYGIDVEGEGRVVQDWFDHLDPIAQDEIIVLILHLASLPMGLWRRPEYDPLDGEGVISELRADEVRTEEGTFTYRIYGLRSHPDKNSYTFLLGTDKDLKNDIEGKRFAKMRVAELASGKARPHKFNLTP
jgi:hypothetical protein